METLFYCIATPMLMALLWMVIMVVVTGRPYKLTTQTRAMGILDDIVARVLLEEVEADVAIEEFRSKVGARYLWFSPRYINAIYGAWRTVINQRHPGIFLGESADA